MTATATGMEVHAIQRIPCGRIWGGNTEADIDVQTQVVSASVLSTAIGGVRGGDIYYLSACGGDVVTRIALADMRGHGERVGQLSQWLYDSLQSRINSMDGAGVLASLNGLVCDHGFDALTTAMVVTYNSCASTLYHSCAGHPPLLMRQGSGAWASRPIEDDGRPANLPLGIMRAIQYDVAGIHMNPGDRICLYTDGVVECPGPDGDFYGEQRLLDILNRTSHLSIREVKEAVFENLREHAGGSLRHDDCTLIVLEVRDQA